MTYGITSYRDLEVWRYALNWTEAVYRASATWPGEERFGLTSQVRRAAVSIASNIAEGSARRTTGEFLQFLGMARGSLAEAETQVLIATRLGYISGDTERELLKTASQISRMLVSLSSALTRRKGGRAHQSPITSHQSP